MKSINEKIEGFFEREVKFLRPIGPMAFLISMAGSSPPTDQQTPYRRFASVESRMFYAKSTITVALNQMGTEESRPLRDRLIPLPTAQALVSVTPRQWP